MAHEPLLYGDGAASLSGEDEESLLARMGCVSLERSFREPPESGGAPCGEFNAFCLISTAGRLVGGKV